MNEFSQLGQLFGDQIEAMKGKVRADTLPCPKHGTESEKLGTYASFPSSFTEYGCPEGHTFKVQVGTTREDILAYRTGDGHSGLQT